MPLFFLWIWYAIKTRSLFYFSAANPLILTGGMAGESKYSVLEMLPERVRPKSSFVSYPTTIEQLHAKIYQEGFTYPVVFKPDLGERGWKVKIINNQDEAVAYWSEIKTDFIIQEWIDLPLEFGVFYVRMPDEPVGRVTSVTGKEFLTVTGDGFQTLEALINNHPRALLQKKKLFKDYMNQWDRVIPKGEKVELGKIGNHCLGTAFINYGHLISPALHDSFNAIAKAIPEFYYGRFDLKCRSIEDLLCGNFMVMELNGCGAEPAHIYQPGYSLWTALSDLVDHWKKLYQISEANHKRGIPYLSFKQGINIFRNFRNTVKE